MLCYKHLLSCKKGEETFGRSNDVVLKVESRVFLGLYFYNRPSLEPVRIPCSKYHKPPLVLTIISKANIKYLLKKIIYISLTLTSLWFNNYYLWTDFKVIIVLKLAISLEYEFIKNNCWIYSLVKLCWLTTKNIESSVRIISISWSSSLVSFSFQPTLTNTRMINCGLFVDISLKSHPTLLQFKV